jgi:midasin (ATPase involved in ribosome maturation)
VKISLYEAFSLAFLTELNRASHPVIRDLISKGPGSQIAYQTVKQRVQQCKLEGFKERPALLALQEF